MQVFAHLIFGSIIGVLEGLYINRELKQTTTATATATRTMADAVHVHYKSLYISSLSFAKQQCEMNNRARTAVLLIVRQAVNAIFATLIF